MLTNIVEYYEKHRIGDKSKIFDVSYLEDLFFTDNKKLHFIVFYYYLTESVIPMDIRYSNLISMFVSTLVYTTKDNAVFEYFNSYFNIHEFNQQWDKIHKEVEMFKKRESLNRIT